MENWKNIESYVGYYKISDRGRVKSIEREVDGRPGRTRTVWERILKPGVGKSGYLYVNLCREGKVKTCYIHRLVAQAFLVNPKNLPEVEHDDGIKSNNLVSNLIWMTHQENVRAAHRSGQVNYNGRHHPRARAILQMSKLGEIIKEFDCIQDAQRALGIWSSSIGDVCRGKQHCKTAGGFGWRYV